mmetsp:Transcript_47954/g.108850  ORF Transcript_47954/g.108850 Transcript_47954/m.108850 type:complete len:239 (+) Transcript_47954:89-805(+)
MLRRRPRGLRRLFPFHRSAPAFFRLFVVFAFGQVRARFPGVTRVADVCAGHGLLSWLLLVLSIELEARAEKPPCPSKSPSKSTSGSSAAPGGGVLTAVCVDVKMPGSAEVIAGAMLERWPELEGRWSFVEAGLLAVDPHQSTLITSLHACGSLSDLVVGLAIQGRCKVALVPCCHTVRKKWTPHPLAGPGAYHEALRQVKEDGADLAQTVDETRTRALRVAGFKVGRLFDCLRRARGV